MDGKSQLIKAINLTQSKKIDFQGKKQWNRYGQKVLEQTF